METRLPTGFLPGLTVFAAFALLFAFQAWNLDADPSPIKRMGDFFDEGYWQHNARCKVLFGTFVPDDLCLLVGAPVFTFLQWGAFATLGPSLLVARIVPLLALWLTLLMVYRMLRGEFSAGIAFLGVFMLGFLHEMLMYCKWSTPIPVEMMFFTASLFFWDTARKRHFLWATAAGACMSLAVFSKLSTLFCSAGVVAFVIAGSCIRPEITRRHVLAFAAGVMIMTAAVGLLVILPFRHELAVLWNVIGAQNVRHSSHLTVFVHRVAEVVRLAGLIAGPGLAIMLMLASLRLLHILATAKGGIRSTLARLSHVEFCSWFFLGGSILAICLGTLPIDRRFVSLYVPLGMLAFFQVVRGWRSSPEGADVSAELGTISRSSQIALFLVFAILWSDWARSVLLTMSGYWLRGLGLEISRTAACAVLIPMTALAYVAILRRRVSWATRVLVVSLFLITVTLNAVWYATTTRTLRDEAQALGRYLAHGDYVAGDGAHSICLQNEAHPIYAPWGREPMNYWLLDPAKCHRFFVLVETDPSTNEPITNDAVTLGAKEVPWKRMCFVTDIVMLPLQFTSSYRFTAKLYMVEEKRF